MSPNSRLPPGPAEVLRDTVDAETWRAVARDAAARHGISGAVEPFASGSEAVFAVGDRHVLKITAPRWHDELRTETALLARVTGRLPIEVPEPLGEGEIDTWPYVLLTRVPGTALSRVWPGLDARSRRQIACDIGRLIAALWCVPTDPWPGCPPADGFIAERLAAAVGHHRRRAPSPRVAAGVEAALAPFCADPTRLTTPGLGRVVLHTELLDEHLLVERRDGRWRLSAALDFADGMIGDAAYEIGAPVEFVFAGAPGCLGTLLDAAGWPVPWSEEERARLFAWYLLHRYGDVGRLARRRQPSPTTADTIRDALFVR